MRRKEQPVPGMQRVTMTKTMPGSEDGIHVQEYVKGETYEMGEALAQAFLGSKCARPAAPDQTDEKDKKDKTDKKAAKGPDQNK